MQTEYIYPKLGNRMSPKEWNDAERPILIDQAIARKNEILANAQIKFDPAFDAAIRADYNIYFK
jgi:trimethylamine--corrinoid protein Co-methyltransferase